MNSTVVKRSIVINGRKTSVSIEDMFWRSLKEVAKDSRMTVSDLVCVIAANRAPGSNLSSAIRVYILTCFTGLLHALRSGGESSGVTVSLVRSAEATPMAANSGQ